MSKDAYFRAAQSRSVYDAGMNQPIEDDDIVLADQRADRSDGGSVTAREHQRRLGFFESRERFLQFMVRQERAADQPGRAGASAIFFDRFDRGGFQARIIGQAQIIV